MPHRLLADSETVNMGGACLLSFQYLSGLSQLPIATGETERPNRLAISKDMTFKVAPSAFISLASGSHCVSLNLSLLSGRPPLLFSACPHLVSNDRHLPGVAEGSTKVSISIPSPMAVTHCLISIVDAVKLQASLSVDLYNRERQKRSGVYTEIGGP